MEKAVVLLSGGMDSAVTLYMARERHRCHALTFDYGQKAAREINSAKKVAKEAAVSHRILKVSLPWKGSSLIDRGKAVPKKGNASSKGEIPSTYVPARNIIFLSFGVSFAETIGAQAVFIGAHQLDFSNYPDCRKSFFEKFQETIDQGTRSGTKGKSIKIMTPVLNRTKKEIVEIGRGLGVPFKHTWSCYEGGRRPCGTCESCLFRKKAFEEIGIRDLSR